MSFDAKGGDSTMKKILLVDDDVDLVEQYKIALESVGFTVEIAYDSKEGMKKFSSFKPDLCILDLAMETYDAGFVLAYKIKKTEHGKNTLVYILTSAGKDTDFRFSVSTNEEKSWIKADGYLEKPLRPSDLVQYVGHKILRQKK